MYLTRGKYKGTFHFSFPFKFAVPLECKIFGSTGCDCVSTNSRLREKRGTIMALHCSSI